ncbi:hypothetical protein [Gramella sp. MAR_2010_147]|uniref:hypothetical protein n=1 Tax=Gramella sp. MAR_2010_147 TaxID=1250205 RepID=UPI000879DB10|nr:hypothetical protein [Gramella sp. MAR_2010_147]SDS69020.1 hypothetical protein SAMN04488553_2861 [Gramella sp. MAR_2010_147]
MNRFKKVLLIFYTAVFIISCSTDNSNDPGSNTIDRSANLKNLGSSASDLLSDVTFTSLNIEMVYVEGNRPTDEAINQFRGFLQSRIYKPDGIQINLRAANSSGKAPFSVDEIVAIEKEERTAYNVGDEIAVWIYFADGKNEKDTNEKFVLGSAYRNTSMVIYERTIREFANRTGAPDRATIEAATLNHEFGHLFGLVNLGTTPVSNHEDPENDGHCVIEGCLMRASIEFGSGVINVIDGGGVPNLDDACIEDLQSVGGR